MSKFKALRNRPKEDKKYEDIAAMLRSRKKVKDPMNEDKSFLLHLVKEFEDNDIFLPEEEKIVFGNDTSGHAKQILDFLQRREKLWEQLL